jgi:hypothetical protein
MLLQNLIVRPAEDTLTLAYSADMFTHYNEMSFFFNFVGPGVDALSER